MIYTVFADISSFDTEQILKRGALPRPEYIEKNEKQSLLLSPGIIETPMLAPEVIDRINKATNPDVKKQRCSSYLLLCALCNKALGYVPKITWTNSGKPKFVNNSLYFNISHTNGIVAVSISDEGAVGVDVEGLIDEARAARLEKRFFSELSISDRPLSVCYYVCRFLDDGMAELVCIDKDNEENADSEDSSIEFKRIHSSEHFSAKWTLYEASLKCDGGGFISLPCLNMLLLECKADLRKFKIADKEYYLTTAGR